jgi:F0F1-type ATP synthase delta subunit
MIELTPLARPYAKALFASTLELDATEETGNDLKLMAKISSSH